MRYLCSLLLAAVFSCGAWAEVAPAGPAEATVAPAAPAPAADSAVEESVQEAGLEAEEQASGEAAEEDTPAAEKTFFDKLIALIKSLEILIGAIAGLLVAIGIAAPWIARLRKAQAALHTVTEKIEENRAKHKVATDNLKKDISSAAPKGTALGDHIHAAAQRAAKKVNGQAAK